jgi:hypothetical protein
MDDDGDPRSREPLQPHGASGSRMKALATWGVVLGTAVWTTFFFCFLVANAVMPEVIPDSWFLHMVRDHPSATLGIAMSAMSAFSVVAVLDVLSRDPIEIKFLGFELRGAAGPVVLWVLCFLAMVAGGEILWDNGPAVAAPAATASASAEPSLPGGSR